VGDKKCHLLQVRVYKINYPSRNAACAAHLWHARLCQTLPRCLIDVTIFEANFEKGRFYFDFL